MKYNFTENNAIAMAASYLEKEISFARFEAAITGENVDYYTIIQESVQKNGIDDTSKAIISLKDEELEEAIINGSFMSTKIDYVLLEEKKNGLGSYTKSKLGLIKDKLVDRFSAGAKNDSKILAAKVSHGINRILNRKSRRIEKVIDYIVDNLVAAKDGD